MTYRHLLSKLWPDSTPLKKGCLRGATALAFIFCSVETTAFASEENDHSYQSFLQQDNDFEQGDHKAKTDFKKVCVSLDGGGVRGFFQGLFLRRLESKVREITNVQDLKIGECIDFVMGTSTGSITGGILSYPDQDHPSKPAYSAHYLVDFFNDNISQVFERTWWQKIRSGFGLFEELYPDAGFNKLTQELFAYTPLSNACIPTVLSSLELRDTDKGSRPHLFRSYNNVGDDFHNITFSEAVRSSGAAPTYFEPSTITDSLGNKHYFVDGGLGGVNNPATQCYLDARSLFDKEVANDNLSIPQINNQAKKEPYSFLKKEDYFFLSLGTGKAPLYINGEAAKTNGLLGWSRSLISLMLDGPSMQAEDSMLSIFRSCPDSYTRFQPTLESPIDLADTSKKALNTMSTVATLYIVDNEAEFDRIADIMAKRYLAKNPLMQANANDEWLEEEIIQRG